MAGGSLRDKRAAQIAARQQPPKPAAAAVPGMLEPPHAAVSQPEAPKEPNVPEIASPPAARESVPAPAAVAPPAVLPPLVAKPAANPPAKEAPKPPRLPAAPAVAAAPAAPVGAGPIDDGEPESLTTGDLEVHSAGVATVRENVGPRAPAQLQKGPESEPAFPQRLAPLDIPNEETPTPAAIVPPGPLPPRELKRKEAGKVAFSNVGDNGMLPCRFKLSYMGEEDAYSAKFLLIGRDYERTLVLAVNQPVSVAVKGKNDKEVVMTLTYTGVSKNDGAKEVEYSVEGGISAVTGIFERVRSIGPATVSAFRTLMQHLPETITLGFAGALAVCGFTIDAIAEKLGTLHPYVTAAVPAVIAGLGVWAWAERNRAIGKENENAQ